MAICEYRLHAYVCVGFFLCVCGAVWLRVCGTPPTPLPPDKAPHVIAPPGRWDGVRKKSQTPHPPHKVPHYPGYFVRIYGYNPPTTRDILYGYMVPCPVQLVLGYKLYLLSFFYLNPATVNFEPHSTHTLSVYKC